MISLMLPFAILCGLSLAALAVSALAFVCSRKAVSGGAQKRRLDSQAAPALDEMRRRIDGIANEVQQIRSQPAAVTAAPKPAMNLSKRSQALRLHRRGDSTEQIAGALGIPCQEVELLIKVQRIAMSGI